MLKTINIGVLILVCFLLNPCAFLFAQETSAEKNEKLMSLIRITKVDENFILMARNRVEQFKKVNGSVPQDLWVEAEKRVDINQQITNVIVESYSESLSVEDIEKILQIIEISQWPTLPSEIYAQYPELFQKFNQARGKAVKALEELERKVSVETEEFLKSKGYSIQIPEFSNMSRGGNIFLGGKK